jgi:predicted MFS family arabinose efflux permease
LDQPAVGRRALPLALATMGAQATMVTLAPLLVAIGRDFDASVGTVGQARTANAFAAVAASALLGPVIDRVGVRAPLRAGGLLVIAGAGASAAAPNLVGLFVAQAIAGLGVAALLSCGFAGVALFTPGARARPMGYVVASQALGWVVGLPLIGVLSDAFSWRAAFAVPAAAGAVVFVAAGRLDPSGLAGASRGGLLSVLRERSARNWALAELIAYAAWTSEITYIASFYITHYGISRSLVGFLLGIGSSVFAITTLSTVGLLSDIGRKPAIAVSAMGMAVALPIGFNVAPAVGFTLAVFSSMALCAGIRSTVSSSLGLVQLPLQPGSMMAARTASAQFGYVLGASGGGLLIDRAGFGTLGWVLGAVMVFAALLVLRVDDPGMEPRGALPDPVD